MSNVLNDEIFSPSTTSIMFMSLVQAYKIPNATVNPIAELFRNILSAC